MRGSEFYGKQTLDHKVIEFLIPMRGSELSMGKLRKQFDQISDPHEG